MPIHWHTPHSDDDLANDMLYLLLLMPLATIPVLARFLHVHPSTVARTLAAGAANKQMLMRSTRLALLGKRSQHVWYLTPRGHEVFYEVIRELQAGDDPARWSSIPLPPAIHRAKVFDEDMLSLVKRLPRMPHFLTLYTVAATLFDAFRAWKHLNDASLWQEYRYDIRFDYVVRFPSEHDDEPHFAVDAIWYVGQRDHTQQFAHYDPAGDAYPLFLLMDDGIAPLDVLKLRCLRLRLAQKQCSWWHIPPTVILVSDPDRAYLWQRALQDTERPSFQPLHGGIYLANHGFGWPMTNGAALHLDWQHPPQLYTFTGQEMTWEALFRCWTNGQATQFYDDGRISIALDARMPRLLREIQSNAPTTSIEETITLMKQMDKENQRKSPSVATGLYKRPRLCLGDYAEHGNLALTLGQRYGEALTSIALAPLMPITDWAYFMRLTLRTAAQYIRDLRARELIECVTVRGGDMFPSWGTKEVECVRATVKGIRFVESLYHFRHLPAWESHSLVPYAHDPGVFHYMRLLDDAARTHHNGKMTWRTGPQITLLFPDEEQVYRAIRPDAAGQLHIGKRRWPLMLEFDRSTENSTELADKIRKYRSYADDQINRWRKGWRQQTPAIRLLWVTTTDAQYKRLDGMLKTWSKELKPDEPVIFASYLGKSWEAEERDLLDRVWRREVPSVAKQLVALTEAV